MSLHVTHKRRLLAGALAAAALLAWRPVPASAQSLAERANRGLVEIATSSTFGTSARMAEDLADVLDDGATRRIVPVIGKGSLQNLVDVKVMRGIDMAIVQTDVLEYARQQHNPPGVETLTYIAKLGNEEFHLLARSDVKSVNDLAGKKVNFGVQGDGTLLTGAKIFDSLKIKVEATTFDQAQALEKLRSGEIAAMAYVSGKPAPLFLTLRPQDNFHFLSVPLKSEMTSIYLPARLTSDDYPGLVGVDAPVDTVAVGTVLMAANLTPDSDRYRNVANFVDAFFTQYSSLLDPGHHPKWKEVNLAAELPNWHRFGPADAWIKRNGGAAPAVSMSDQQMRDIFAKFLDERSKATGQAMNSQQKDELFDQFKRWQEGKVR
ncbi:MAG TPA: TAXI family TRAP transporter solute-binding subunit [Stellaceae bacterium]|nr:TAXI family TRAP transporter solute-binding subunit [Stellaceae bacterium]